MYSGKFVAISLFGLCFKGWPVRLGVSCLINGNFCTFAFVVRVFFTSLKPVLNYHILVGSPLELGI